MAGWLHGVFVGEWLFVFPLCGFSLSLFCNYWVVTRLVTRRVRAHSCVRETCVRRLLCDRLWDYFAFCAGVSGWSMTWCC